MTAEERAAEILAERHWLLPSANAEVSALNAAGLLVTDEIQAVLDAAVAVNDPHSDYYELGHELATALDAYLASRQP